MGATGMFRQTAVDFGLSEQHILNHLTPVTFEGWLLVSAGPAELLERGVSSPELTE